MGSKGKGSAGERKQSRILTKWLTGQDKDLYFWRSPGSGSVATVSMVEGINGEISGDLISLKTDSAFFTGFFSCECKSGYDSASIDKHLKTNKNDEIQSFWEQTIRDANKSNRRPLLFFSKQRLKPWIGTCDKTFNDLKQYLEPLRHVKIKWDNELPDLYLFDEELFLKTITPNIVKEMINENHKVN